MYVSLKLDNILYVCARASVLLYSPMTKKEKSLYCKYFITVVTNCESVQWFEEYSDGYGAYHKRTPTEEITRLAKIHLHEWLPE